MPPRSRAPQPQSTPPTVPTPRNPTGQRASFLDFIYSRQPSSLAGAGQADDRYLQIAQRHGDSTSATAQLQALKSIGLKASLRSVGRRPLEPGGGFCKRSIGSGKAVRYSSKNWGCRWLVDGPATGWWIQIDQ